MYGAPDSRRCRLFVYSPPRSRAAANGSGIHFPVVNADVGNRSESSSITATSTSVSKLIGSRATLGRPRVPAK